MSSSPRSTRLIRDRRLVVICGEEGAGKSTWWTNYLQTRLFEGRPDAEAVESMDLQETDRATKMTYRLAFRDQAGRDHMAKFDGFEANFDNVEDLLRSLLDPEDTVS